MTIGTHPIPTSHTIWACGVCGIQTAQGPSEFEFHCQCGRDGCTDLKEIGRVFCDEHTALFNHDREADLVAAMEWIDWEPGVPLYCANDDRYGEDLDELIESATWDGDYVRDAVVVHPCQEIKIGTPDLAEYLSEVWYEQMSPDDEDAGNLSASLMKQVAIVQEMAEKEASVVWQADTTKRVRLPAREDD